MGTSKAGGRRQGEELSQLRRWQVHRAVNENLSAYGKFCLSYSERKVSVPKAGLYDTVRDTGLYAGLGVQYKLTKNIAAVVKYERYGARKQNGSKADVYSMGLIYDF